MKNKSYWILKLNHFLFPWYYKRVPSHFRKWTLIKSIKILISNFEHQEIVIQGKSEVIRNAIKIEEKLSMELRNLKLSMSASPNQIDAINSIFGTNFNSSNEN